jgi:hypothetical protein
VALVADIACLCHDAGMFRGYILPTQSVIWKLPVAFSFNFFGGFLPAAILARTYWLMAVCSVAGVGLAIWLRSIEKRLVIE